MPRPLRIEYENAWYHVMNRGANHQNIYKNSQHYEIFLDLLNEISKKFYIEIHGYCLMGNHYHLLICTPLANLGRAMRHLDGIYTQKFNRSETRDGSLFRGRYKSILVQSEKYLLQLSRYIHLNPTSAHLCENPYEYPWSSLQYYMNEKCLIPWLKTDTILGHFSKPNQFTFYKEFINQGIDSEISAFYDKKKLLSILGTKEFINSKLITIKNKTPYKPDINRTIPILDTRIVLNVVKNYFKIEENTLIDKTPGKENIFKMTAIYLLSQLGQLNNTKIASYFNVCPANIGLNLKKFECIIQDDFALQKIINELTQQLDMNLFQFDT